MTENNRECKPVQPNDSYRFGIKINDYTLRFYLNAQGDYYVVDATTKKIDDQTIIILMEKGEINYYFMTQIKNTSVKGVITYYFYNSRLYGVNTEANALIDMLLDLIE